MKQQSLVVQRIVCERLLKKGGTLKVYITQKMLSDAKQLAKTAHAENKESQTTGEKRREKTKNQQRN